MSWGGMYQPTGERGQGRYSTCFRCGDEVLVADKQPAGTLELDPMVLPWVANGLVAYNPDTQGAREVDGSMVDQVHGWMQAGRVTMHRAHAPRCRGRRR